MLADCQTYTASHAETVALTQMLLPGLHLVRMDPVTRAWDIYLRRVPPSTGCTVFDISLPKGHFDGMHFCWGGYQNAHRHWGQTGLVLHWPDIREFVIHMANHLRAGMPKQRFDLQFDLEDRLPAEEIISLKRELGKLSV